MPVHPEGVCTDAIVGERPPLKAWLGSPPERHTSQTHSNRQHVGDGRSSNRVLIVGRIRELALYRAEVLRQHGFQVSTPKTKEEAQTIIRNGDFEVAVLSYTLPSTTVQEIAEEVREHWPVAP